MGVGESMDEMIDDGGEWWLSELMKVIRQLLIAWMLVAFLMLQGFGQDDNNFSWSDFTYNSPEEKAFWDNVPDWTTSDAIGLSVLDLDDDLQAFWVFASDGSLADENFTDRYTGYAKSIEQTYTQTSESMDRYGNYVGYQHVRIIRYLKDGMLSKEACFNESGQRLYQHILRDDGLCEEKEWYYNGQIAYKIIFFIKGLWERDYIDAESWLPNGDKCKETNWRNGTGRFCKYYENGQKWSEENYKDGKLDGLSAEWYQDGQKKEEVFYENGKQDGLSIFWYENGRKKYEGNYKEGKQDGLETVWDGNGQKKSETNYKDGKKDGLLTRWHENGQKSSEGNYKDGRQDGLWTSWQEDGNLTRKTKYKDETRTVTHYWVSTGKKKQEDTYKNNKRDGLLTKWFENGQKETEVNYKSGKRLGVFKEWDENGTLIRTGRSINPPRLIRPPPFSNQSTSNPRRTPPPPPVRK